MTTFSDDYDIRALLRSIDGAADPTAIVDSWAPRAQAGLLPAIKREVDALANANRLEADRLARAAALVAERLGDRASLALADAARARVLYEDGRHADAEAHADDLMAFFSDEQSNSQITMQGGDAHDG